MVARLGFLALLSPAIAFAQEPADTPSTSPNASAEPPGASAHPAPAPTPALPPSTVDTAVLAAELSAQKQELEAQKKELESAKKRIGDLESGAAEAQAPAGADTEDILKIYGFTDVGVQRVWIDPTTAVANFLNSANATSFVVGDLDFYFDAKPTKDWRSLVEIRFTNAPHGLVTGVGGLAGTFARTSTQQSDPNSGSVAGQMWGGYTVIERAQIDWTPYDLFKVRVGSFFTPFGIWNVDHGQPTLISVNQPIMFQFGGMPIRQTGVMVFGNGFVGDWELGYMATLTNGRQELSNFAFDDDRGYGARIYANDERGDLTLKFGASGYTGRTRDDEIDATGLSPLTLTSKATWSYREWIGGLDASIDVGRTRIRAEGLVRTVDYDPGKHQAGNQLLTPGAFLPNSIFTSAYVLVAHQLPILGLEPYAMVDMIHGPISVGDTAIGPAVGLNVHFNPSVMLKTQVERSYFLDLRKERGDYVGESISQSNLTFAIARLVVVF